MSSNKEISDALRNACAKKLLEASTVAGSSNDTSQYTVKEEDYDFIYILTSFDKRGKLWYIVHDPKLMPETSTEWVALPANNIKEVLLHFPWMFETSEAAEQYRIAHNCLDFTVQEIKFLDV